jgi:hypothetical protein
MGPGRTGWPVVAVLAVVASCGWVAADASYANKRGLAFANTTGGLSNESTCMVKLRVQDAIDSGPGRQANLAACRSYDKDNFDDKDRAKAQFEAWNCSKMTECDCENIWVTHNQNETVAEETWVIFQKEWGYALFLGVGVALYLSVVVMAVVSTMADKLGKAKPSARSTTVIMLGVGASARALSFAFVVEEEWAEALKEITYAIKDVFWIGAFCLIILYWVQLQKSIRKSAGLANMKCVWGGGGGGF